MPLSLINSYVKILAKLLMRRNKIQLDYGSKGGNLGSSPPKSGDGC